MNRTQKGAWFTLAYSLLCIALSIYLLIRIAVLKQLPERWFAFWIAVAFCFLMAASIIFLRKKQSPGEVDSDERDRQIQRRAALAGFVAVWILLFVSSAIPLFALGAEGALPVWALPLINVNIAVVALLVYTVAVLVQYSKGGGGDGGK